MTSPVSRLPRPATETGRDALGAGALAVALAVLIASEDGFAALIGIEGAALLIACAVLVWRRRLPVVVLVLVGLAFAASTLALDEVSVTIVPLAIALYTAVSRAAHVPVALAIGALAVVATGAVLVVGPARSATDPVVVSAEIWMALVTAVGIAMSLYRRSVAQERERTRQAEETREALARGRVAEERLRIARELHDAVGHHVAVMNVQAGVAEALLATDPARASEALVRVQEAGARVLEELPVMLRVLRQDEQDIHPTAGLARLDALVDEARDAGLDVTLTAADLPDDLPAASDHAAYRIVQEALANARRYGTGKASVAIASEPGSLRIEVRNTVDDARPAGHGSGFGLVGMGERATAAGGEVAAVRVGDAFVVRATLPTNAGEAR